MDSPSPDEPLVRGSGPRRPRLGRRRELSGARPGARAGSHRSRQVPRLRSCETLQPRGRLWARPRRRPPTSCRLLGRAGEGQLWTAPGGPRPRRAAVMRRRTAEARGGAPCLGPLLAEEGLGLRTRSFRLPGGPTPARRPCAPPRQCIPLCLGAPGLSLPGVTPTDPAPAVRVCCAGAGRWLTGSHAYPQTRAETALPVTPFCTAPHFFNALVVSSLSSLTIRNACLMA